MNKNISKNKPFRSFKSTVFRNSGVGLAAFVKMPYFAGAKVHPSLISHEYRLWLAEWGSLGTNVSVRHGSSSTPWKDSLPLFVYQAAIPSDLGRLGLLRSYCQTLSAKWACFLGSCSTKIRKWICFPRFTCHGALEELASKLFQPLLFHAPKRDDDNDKDNKTTTKQ